MIQSLLPNILEFIHQIDPFDKLPAERQKKVASCVNISDLSREEKIDFHPSDPKRYLYIIRTGVMEQSKPNGMLHAKLDPQNLFGFTFLEDLAGGEESYSVIAAESTFTLSNPP